MKSRQLKTYDDVDSKLGEMLLNFNKFQSALKTLEDFFDAKFLLKEQKSNPPMEKRLKQAGECLNSFLADYQEVKDFLQIKLDERIEMEKKAKDLLVQFESEKKNSASSHKPGMGEIFQQGANLLPTGVKEGVAKAASTAGNMLPTGFKDSMAKAATFTGNVVYATVTTISGTTDTESLAAKSHALSEQAKQSKEELKAKNIMPRYQQLKTVFEKIILFESRIKDYTSEQSERLKAEDNSEAKNNLNSLNNYLLNIDISFPKECDLILISTPLTQDNLNKFPIRSNEAYVRSEDKLFYVNKATKKIVEVSHDAQMLKKFDEEMKPSSTAITLTKTQLFKITELTGHFIMRLLPEKISLTATTNKENVSANVAVGAMENKNPIKVKQNLAMISTDFNAPLVEPVKKIKRKKKVAVTTAPVIINTPSPEITEDSSAALEDSKLTKQKVESQESTVKTGNPVIEETILRTVETEPTLDVKTPTEPIVGSMQIQIEEEKNDVKQSVDQNDNLLQKQQSRMLRPSLFQQAIKEPQNQDKKQKTPLKTAEVEKTPKSKGETLDVIEEENKDANALNQELEKKGGDNLVFYQLTTTATLGAIAIANYLQRLKNLKLWRAESQASSAGIDNSIVKWLEERVNQFIDSDRKAEELSLLKSTLDSDYFQTELSPDFKNKVEILNIKVQFLEKNSNASKADIEKHLKSSLIYQALERILSDKIDFWSTQLFYKKGGLSVFDHLVPVGVGEIINALKASSKDNFSLMILESMQTQSNTRLKTFWTYGRSDETKKLYTILKDVDINRLEKDSAYFSDFINKLDAFSREIDQKAKLGIHPS